MNSLTSGLGGGQAQIDLANFGISITLTGYLLLGVIFFISILAALALAVSFSVFSEDVRSAQTSVSYIYVIILIPTLLFMFMDLSALPFPMQVVLLIIPFTHTMLATKDIIIGNYSTVIFNILYLTIFSSVVLYIAAKLFTTEKVFTTKLTFRRRRKEQKNL
jgi:ABC-2 type transport system permease protein